MNDYKRSPRNSATKVTGEVEHDESARKLALAKVYAYIMTIPVREAISQAGATDVPNLEPGFTGEIHTFGQSNRADKHYRQDNGENNHDKEV